LSYLLDTNVISELRKRERGDEGVVRWARAVEPRELYTSVLVIGELRRGIALKRRSDAAQAEGLALWLERVRREFGARILPIDERIADVWSGMGIPDRLPVVDALLTATSIVHGLTMVTRDVSDVTRAGAKVLNPFAA
jgi:hypothetical protein